MRGVCELTDILSRVGCCCARAHCVQLLVVTVPLCDSARSLSCSGRGACRAAQRRFRERQKCLITDLKVRAETLQKENEAQRRRIAELEKENSVRCPAKPWRSKERIAWPHAVKPCR